MKENNKIVECNDNIMTIEVLDHEDLERVKSENRAFFHKKVAEFKYQVSKYIKLTAKVKREDEFSSKISFVIYGLVTPLNWIFIVASVFQNDMYIILRINYLACMVCTNVSIALYTASTYFLEKKVI